MSILTLISFIVYVVPSAWQWFIHRKLAFHPPKRTGQCFGDVLTAERRGIWQRNLPKPWSVLVFLVLVIFISKFLQANCGLLSQGKLLVMFVDFPDASVNYCQLFAIASLLSNYWMKTV